MIREKRATHLLQKIGYILSLPFKEEKKVTWYSFYFSRPKVKLMMMMVELIHTCFMYFLLYSCLYSKKKCSKINRAKVMRWEISQLSIKNSLESNSWSIQCSNKFTTILHLTVALCTKKYVSMYALWPHVSFPWLRAFLYVTL